MTAYSQTLKHGDTLAVAVADDPITPPPVDPPPVEPPPNSIVVKPAAWNQAYLDARKDGEVILLDGDEFNTPFLRMRSAKVTLQAYPGRRPILTCKGRPDVLYHQIDGTVRGLRFVSQSPGFSNDSQGAALTEVLGDTVGIGLVWYDDCDWVGTPKMGTTEQLAYLNDRGKAIAEVRFTGGSMDGLGSKGFGIHPYDGPSPKLVSVSRMKFDNLPQNAAVLNAANAGIVKVDHATFGDGIATYARGMYGPVDVSASRLHGNAIGQVNDLGGNTR